MEDAPQKEKSPLEVFHEEMHRLKQEEMLKKTVWEARGRQGQAYDPHFDQINPDDLTDEDRVIWQKIQDQTLTREELNQYSVHFKEMSAEDASHQKSRYEFRAMAINKAVFIVRKEHEARKKQGS